MADAIDNIFGDSDSDASFDGFESDDVQEDHYYIANNNADNGVDFEADLRLGWRRNVENILVPPFLANPGITTDSVHEESGPQSFLNLFLRDADYGKIADETNIYAAQVMANRQFGPHSRLSKWFDTCANEIKRFLGLTLLMGLVEKPTLSDYWTIDPRMETPIFGEKMTRDRFMNILSFLHINNNENARPRGHQAFDPIYKVRPIYDILSSRFRTTYIPSEHICIDEAMVPWQGRLVFRQYIPNKPDRFGVKLYTLCDSENSYTCDFDVYTGGDYKPNPNADNIEQEQGHSYHVVLGLLRRAELLDKGYTLYIDNYYSSPFLFDSLSAVDTSAVGTVRMNRKEIPMALKGRTRKGDVVFRQRENLLALKWTDKRDVYMLSTKHKPAMCVTGRDRNGNQIIKPECVHDYNTHMGGVDTNDQLGKYYSFTRKTLKWWVKLFFYMFNQAVLNAYILYKITNRNPVTHFKFRLDLAQSLIDSFVSDKQPRGRPSETRVNEERLNQRHFPDFIPPQPGAKKQRPTKPCIVCNKKLGHRRREGESYKRTETRYWCPDCKKPMCVVPCFRRYHTLVHYRLNDSDSD